MELPFRDQLKLIIIDKAVIGGFLVIAAFYFNRALERFRASQSVELENFKNHFTIAGESRRDVRLAVAEIIKRVAAANHAINWLCWKAKYAPGDLSIKDLQNYDEQMNAVLGDIAAARTVLAALSPSVHEQLSTTVSRLYALDAKVSEAKAAFTKDRNKVVLSLADFHQSSWAFDSELLDAVEKLAWESDLEK